MFLRLLDALAARELGQEDVEQAESIQQAERGICGFEHEDPRELVALALGRGLVNGGGPASDLLRGRGLNVESQFRRNTWCTEEAQRIVGEDRRRVHANDLCA